MKLAISAIETPTRTFFQSQNRNLKFFLQLVKSYSMPLISIAILKSCGEDDASSGKTTKEFY